MPPPKKLHRYEENQHSSTFIEQIEVGYKENHYLLPSHWIGIYETLLHVPSYYQLFFHIVISHLQELPDGSSVLLNNEITKAG